MQQLGNNCLLKVLADLEKDVRFTSAGKVTAARVVLPVFWQAAYLKLAPCSVAWSKFMQAPRAP
jgi:hypothetical protein